MFEKEAEEIANKKLCSERICYNRCNFNSSKHHRCGEWHRCYESAKKGAEFGYNKANEWHDLRKNPQDLPKDENDVLIYSGEDWRMCVGRYSPKYKSWEAGCDTIAWMEIPEPPKQERQEDDNQPSLFD